MNTRRKEIWHEVFCTHEILLLPILKWEVIGPEHNMWYKFHKVEGHHIEGGYQHKKDIEHLI